LGDALHQYLIATGVPAEPSITETGNHGVQVPARSTAECRRAGKAVAAWVEQVPIDFKLRIDGPFADSTLHRLGTEYDEEIISESIEAAAYRQ
jgi:hypothetical protein